MSETPESPTPPRIHRYGPSLVLLGTVLIVLVAGPHVMRQLARADQQARIEVVDEALGDSQLAEMAKTFRWVAQRVEPSVVHISTKRRADGTTDGQWPPGSLDELRRRFNGGSDPLDQYNEPRDLGSGSGWVFDEAGHIITNNHVVEGADIVEVKFFDKTTRRATVIGSDPRTDIAVLRVEGANLYPAKLSVSEVEQGDLVFAFGSPFMFEFSMSQGIVSGEGRRLGILGRQGYEDFIQTDAAINPGNSGGPLTNIYGEVVGMNTAIATRTGVFSGIGFAIPIEMVTEIAEKLIETGEVRRGYLGVWISDDRELLESFGVEAGVLIDDAIPGGPAAKVGLKAGDIIVGINGQPVGSASDLRRRVAAVDPGDEIEITYVREGEQQTVTTTLQEQPRIAGGVAPRGPVTGDEAGTEPRGQAALAKLGVEGVETMTEEIARRMGQAFTAGVIVTRVRPGSVADANLIDTGVVITHVQGERVTTVAQLESMLAAEDLTAGVRVRVQIRGQNHFVILQLPR